MKSGTYTVSFQVDLTDCHNEEAASEAVRGMLSEMIDDDQDLEVNFEMIEEFEDEYRIDDNQTEELEF